MTKALIVYGTRYGATAGTSEEIAKVLHDEGMDIRVVNAKEERIVDISEYDLIIVGSGMRFGKWVDEPEKFLKEFQKELAEKKVAIFVSSGLQAIEEREGKPELSGKAQRKYLEEKVAKYSLQPIALGLFGGVWDFNKMGAITRNAMSTYKRKLEAVGFKEVKPGYYDTRDWNSIRNWAKEIAQKARSP